MLTNEIILRSIHSIFKMSSLSLAKPELDELSANKVTLGSRLKCGSTVVGGPNSLRSTRGELKAISFILPSSEGNSINHSPNNSSGWSGIRKSTFPVVGRRGCKCIWRLEKSTDGWFIEGGFIPGEDIPGACCWREMTFTPFGPTEIVNRINVMSATKSFLRAFAMLSLHRHRLEGTSAHRFSRFQTRP